VWICDKLPSSTLESQKDIKFLWGLGVATNNEVETIAICKVYACLKRRLSMLKFSSGGIHPLSLDPYLHGVHLEILVSLVSFKDPWIKSKTLPNYNSFRC